LGRRIYLVCSPKNSMGKVPSNPRERMLISAREKNKLLYDNGGLKLTWFCGPHTKHRIKEGEDDGTCWGNVKAR